MPTSVTVRSQVQLPTVEEFLDRYAHYTSIQTSESFLWDIVVTGENAIAARVATRLGIPAVAVVADSVREACAARRRELSGYIKQMTGALVCSLMMANGDEPTGTKRSVGRTGWNRGEVYALNP